jgi:Protein of unknown function (DUF1552)
MIITKVSLPRRAFLRGAGATLALPLLDAMVPALTAAAGTAATPVRRLGVVYVPNGIDMDRWTPTTQGSGFELTPILQPLAPFRERMLVVSGLDGARSKGSHSGAASRFLTGFGGTSSPGGVLASTSIDQIVAKEFGRHTQLASLELSLDGRDEAGSCDANPCGMSNTISWHSPTVPVPMENNPRIVFERLFGDVGSTDAAARLARFKRDRSILDSVTRAASALGRRLGPGDRTRLNEYLDGVRDIESRIQKAEEQNATELPVVTQPAGVPVSFEEYAKLMFDLQVLAYQCDLTRVITFMIGREFSGRSYPEIGVPDAHHPLSHHQYDPEKVALMAKLNTYHASLFAYYLGKLDSTKEGGGSLLDHLLLIYGAGMSDSNSHDPRNLPMLLFGGAGQIKGGRHLKYAAAPPAANLLVNVVDKLGIPVERIGNSTGELNVDVDTLSGL